eukprot:gnl/TRDRNA2_/TRDRNA2_183514_c0_seq1.p2 gnl/TRDRNA2_/TRDRNA2_183514_c0~~gnl/TRDRNA2_/TRDRNA2_183514_c0_seq1.p2  ORF type:complete len:196 (-),score=54.48 gnl/TRDRNA2_/TRDRNA2_183514_c0_seq1:314-901(-)
MSNMGTVKSFSAMKGYGFIDCNGTDIFVHYKDCSGGGLQVGDTVTFEMVESEKKPGTYAAKTVTGGTGGAPGVLGSGASRGTVKSFNAEKGWGFITCNVTGVDVFVHIRDCQGGQPQAGDTVAFDQEPSPTKPGQMKASNVTGGTQPLNMGGKGGYDMGSWGGKGGYGAMTGDWGMPTMNPYMTGSWGGKGKGKW